MDLPYLTVAATVPEGNRLVRFHACDGGGVAAWLANPARFRPAGFDVAIPAYPVQGPDGCLEQQWGDRKQIRLYQDGTLIVRVRADHEFLGWGLEPRDFARFPRLNPVAVLEFLASVAHLTRDMIARLKHQPASVLFRLELTAGGYGNALYLTKYYPPKTRDWSGAPKYLLQETDSAAEVEIESAELAEHPNRAGFKLVELFASWFDMEGPDIPFVVQGDGGLEVDVAAIAGL